MTGDLAVWLRARLDNDETLATQSGTRSCWRVAFTLADITAKRAILELHREVAPAPLAYPRSSCLGCDRIWPCRTLRLLAQPYAGRPGWHNEWSV